MAYGNFRETVAVYELKNFRQAFHIRIDFISAGSLVEIVEFSLFWLDAAHTQAQTNTHLHGHTNTLIHVLIQRGRQNIYTRY